MLSLLFLIGGIAGLSMIVPSDDTGDEGDTVDDTPVPVDYGGTAGDDSVEGDDEAPETGDLSDGGPGPTSGATITASGDPVLSAETIVLTDAEGIETSYALADHLVAESGDAANGMAKYEFDFADQSSFVYTVEWETDPDEPGAGPLLDQSFDVHMSDATANWDYRTDGFTISLFDDAGEQVGDPSYDIDTLVAGQGANTIWTTNTIQVESTPDGQSDRIYVMVDEVAEGESFETAGLSDDDGGITPPADAIMPSHELLQDNLLSPYEADDQLVVSIDEDLEGYVHLMKVTVSESVTLADGTIQAGTYNTVDYLVQTDSADPPSVSDLNVQARGAVMPEDGLTVLAAFVVESGVETAGFLFPDTDYVDPEYSGKPITTTNTYGIRLDV
ncbi:hypothetical protein [Aliiroseovarius crassostreae]|uniref:hypothetical protein n=1 Tax=Aliiroseovarius crassostreae TaxID=154981 RepID=UPI003C7D7BF4